MTDEVPQLRLYIPSIVAKYHANVISTTLGFQHSVAFVVRLLWVTGVIR